MSLHVCIAFLFVGMLTASPAFSQSGPRPVSTCSEALSARDDQRALDLCTRQIEESTGDPVLRNITLGARGAIYLRLRNYQAALGDFDAVIAQTGRDATPWNVWISSAQAYLGLQRIPEAMRDLDVLLVRFPNNGDAWGVRGAARGMMGDHAGAVEDLTQAIRSAGGLPFGGDQNPRLNRGRAYLNLGRLVEANDDFAEAARRSPQLVEAHAMLGVVAQKKGDHESAVAHLTRAIYLQPDLATLYLQRGQSYRALSNTTQSSADFAKARAFGLKVE